MLGKNKIIIIQISYQKLQMWNLMSSNRILDLKWKRQAQRKHKKALQNIRSGTNTSAPKRYAFLDNKQKTKQLEQQRREEIQSHNSMLVTRMINATSYIKKDPVFLKDSLNSVYLKRVEKDIDQNNQILVQRLQNANSEYSQRRMSKNRRMYDKVKTNMAYSRMDPFYDLNTGRVDSVRQHENLVKRRPFSAKR